MSKKIFILLGHSDKETFLGELAFSYESGARESGFEVRRTNLGEVNFDPILHKGYKEIQELEPGLVKIQEDIKWCDHFVILYPTWWSTMPALLKGMFDRMWLPAFAFKFKKNGFGWDKLLKGKTGRVFVTSDSPTLISRIIFGDNVNEIKRGILSFAGIKTKITKIGGIKKIHEKPKKRKYLIDRLHYLGRRGS